MPWKRAAPIDLSIGDDDEHSRGSFSGGTRRLSLGEGSPRVTRTGSTGAVNSSTTRGIALPKKTVGSPIEDADLLYEYFPLSLDDWFVLSYSLQKKTHFTKKTLRMPPVDAIYRPHVVHHTIVPPDLKAEQVKSKTKRYFSADE
jgi:hypothetical protein